MLMGDDRRAVDLEVPTSDRAHSYIAAYYDAYFGTIWRWLLRKEVTYLLGLAASWAAGLVVYQVAPAEASVFLVLWATAAVGIVLLYEVSRRTVWRDLDSPHHCQAAGQLTVGQKQPDWGPLAQTANPWFLRVGQVLLPVDRPTHDALKYSQGTDAIVEYTKHARLLLEVRDISGWVIWHPGSFGPVQG